MSAFMDETGFRKALPLQRRGFSCLLRGVWFVPLKILHLVQLNSTNSGIHQNLATVCLQTTLLCISLIPM